MENTVTLSLNKYEDYRKIEREKYNLEKVFHGNYTFIGWTEKGYGVYSKDEAFKISENRFREVHDRLVKYKAFYNLPFYKRIFRKI